MAGKIIINSLETLLCNPMHVCQSHLPKRRYEVPEGPHHHLTQLLISHEIKKILPLGIKAHNGHAPFIHSFSGAVLFQPGMSPSLLPILRVLFKCHFLLFRGEGKLVNDLLNFTQRAKHIRDTLKPFLHGSDHLTNSWLNPQ